MTHDASRAEHVESAGKARRNQSVVSATHGWALPHPITFSCSDLRVRGVCKSGYRLSSDGPPGGQHLGGKVGLE